MGIVAGAKNGESSSNDGGNGQARANQRGAKARLDSIWGESRQCQWFCVSWSDSRNGPSFKTHIVAVGQNIVAGAIGCFPRGIRTAYGGVGGRRTDEQQIGSDPFAFAVDVWIDPVAPFRSRSAAGGVDVMSGRADPHLLAIIGFGQFPDADVMAFREGVQRFLQHHIGRPSFQKKCRERWNSRSGARWPGRPSAQTSR